MKIVNNVIGYFKKKQDSTPPIFIIKKNMEDSEIKEYKTIEAAITDLENDRNIPKEKIEKLRNSIELLKIRTSFFKSKTVI